MVVETFNHKDFWDYLEKHSNGINRLFVDLNRKWSKAVREAKDGQSVSLWVEGMYEGNRWVVIRHSKSKNVAFRSYNDVRLCFVQVARDKYQVYDWKNNGRVFVYSSHFFDRYKERMGLKCSRDKAIRLFFRHSDIQMSVYYKNDKFALACEQGLTLGVYDREKNYEIGCTFVDYSLLKASQKAAFDKAIPNFQDVRDQSANLLRHGCSTWQAEDIANERYSELIEVVEEIYAQFFNRYDLI